MNGGGLLIVSYKEVKGWNLSLNSCHNSVLQVCSIITRNLKCIIIKGLKNYKEIQLNRTDAVFIKLIFYSGR